MDMYEAQAFALEAQQRIRFDQAPKKENFLNSQAEKDAASDIERYRQLSTTCTFTR